MELGPSSFRARFAALKQRLAMQNQEAEADAAARQLDAEAVGKRADHRKAERESDADHSRAGSPGDR